MSSEPVPPAEEELLRALFDPLFYRDQYPDIRTSGTDPFRHFMEHGGREGRVPHPLFDTPFYLARCPELAHSGQNPLLHYLRTGAAEGRNPHPLFDTVFYLRQCPDVAAAGVNPLVHFIRTGVAECRDPHPFFRTAAYLAANPDVAASGINPLIHYVSRGWKQGLPLGPPSATTEVADSYQTGRTMRAEIAKSLSGRGIEFGAGSIETAFPLPPGTTVLYADCNSEAHLTDRNYFEGRQLTPIDLATSIEEMAGIADDSVDFIIASHVIEHTPNPIKALRLAFEKLRANGKLVLVVPDWAVTFDKGRVLTTLEHLMADYAMPSRERDFEHYIEWVRRSFPHDDPVAVARHVWDRNDDIHFHTWSYDSFGAFVRHVIDTVVPWRDVWSHPRISDRDVEFFYVLTK